MQEGEAFHFIAYVPVAGALYELDGLKRGPLKLAELPEGVSALSLLAALSDGAPLGLGFGCFLGHMMVLAWHSWPPRGLSLQQRGYTESSGSVP